MSETKRGRGRPVKCDPKVRRAVAGLVKAHGLTKTMSILCARQGKLVELRDKDIFPKAMPLTLPTIRKYATEYGVGELQRGRAAEGAKKGKGKKAEPKKGKGKKAQPKKGKGKKAEPATPEAPKVEAAPVVETPVEAAPVAAETVVAPVVDAAQVAQPEAAPVAAESKDAA